MKTKIKSNSDEVTNFHDNEIPKLGFNHICLAVINLDSALKKDGNNYPQVFLKECKYIAKKGLDILLMTISSDDSDYSKEE